MGTGADRPARRLWPALAAVASIALATSLGCWQLDRGQQKSARGARLQQLAHEPAISVSAQVLDAADVELRRVRARGVFEPKYAVLIDNRLRQGVPGYHVVTPLQLDGKHYVLVNRGWVAAGPDRRSLPRIDTPAGTIVVDGVAVVPTKRFLELSGSVAEGRVWQNLTLERYREAMPIPIQPFVIQQAAEGAPDDGLRREWQAPDLGVDKHYGYAFQWFALAAAILVFWFVNHVRARRKT